MAVTSARDTVVSATSVWLARRIRRSSASVSHRPALASFKLKYALNGTCPVTIRLHSSSILCRSLPAGILIRLIYLSRSLSIFSVIFSCTSVVHFLGDPAFFFGRIHAPQLVVHEFCYVHLYRLVVVVILAMVLN